MAYNLPLNGISVTILMILKNAEFLLLFLNITFLYALLEELGVHINVIRSIYIHIRYLKD